MAGWTGVVTDVGAALLAQYGAGGELAITRATAGDGTVSEAQLVRLTALTHQVQTLSIVSARGADAGVVYGCQFEATGTAYTATQIGIWAQLNGGTETLLAIFQNAAGIAVPAAADMPDYVYTFYATVQMSNAGDLVVELDSSALVSQDQLAEGLAGKVDTGSVADETVSAITEQSASWPELIAGDRVRVLVGKIKKWLGDLKSKLSNLSTSDITGTWPVDRGGTGATEAAGARTNLGAVNKAGDTMTGNLGIKATWPGVSLYANNGTQETGAITSHRDNGRVYIVEHSTDGTNEEYYQLPIADGSGTYGILTTKSPVSSAQGGTGGPYFYTCSGKTSLVVKSSNGWGGFAVMSITASSAHLTAIGFNGTNAPNAVNIYGGDAGLNPQLSSLNTITCTLRSDRHYIIIGTDKVTSISAS